MSKEPGDHRSGTRACDHSKSVNKSIIRQPCPLNTFIHCEIIGPIAPACGSLPYTYSVDSGSKNVQNALSDKPGQPHLPVELFHAKHLDAMKDGHDSAQAHGDEHESPERPPRRRAELREKHDDGGRCSDACDLRGT